MCWAFRVQTDLWFATSEPPFPLDRQMIRGIMWLTGGPIDPEACIEFTSWTEIDAFAVRLAALHTSDLTKPS